MRVALVCGEYAPRRDGVADHVRLLARALREGGDEVVVAAAGESAPVRLASRWDLVGTAAAGRAVARLAPDVVHVHWAPSAYRFSAVAGLLPLALPPGLPVVTTLHEYGWWSWPPRVPAAVWARMQRHGWDRETGLLAPSSRALVVTGEEHAVAVRRRLRREPAVIPLGPNVAPGWTAGRAAARAALGLPDSAEVVVFFGFVHPVKGLRYLLEAVARLREGTHPDLHLLVVGAVESLALRGEEATSFEAELRGQVAALGLAGAVRLTGWLPDTQVSGALAAADVCALPFTHGVTAKSGSLLAAYAAGLPLVVTAAPGASDAGVLGVRCAPRDALSLTAALDRLLGDPPLRESLRRQGLAVAATRGWEGIAAAHAEVYAAAVGG